MDHVEWSKHRDLEYLGAFWDIFSSRNYINALLSSNLVIPGHSRCFLFRKSNRKLEKRHSFREFAVTTLRIVGVLGSELKLFSSLSSKKEISISLT